MTARNDTWQSICDALGACMLLHSASGEIIDFNASALQVLGVTADELRKRTDASWVAKGEDLCPLAVDAFPWVRARRTLGPVRHDTILVARPDGAWRTLRMTSLPTFGNAADAAKATERHPLDNVLTVFCDLADVTQRQQQEAELLISRQQLAEAQALARMGTWKADTATHVFSLSPWLAALLGAGSNSLRLDEMVELVVSEDQQRVRDSLQRALAGEAISIHARVRSSVGRETTDLRLWTRPLLEQPEEEHCVMGIAQDISEQVRLTAKLQLTERMASVGTLAAGVAHEINNPLAYVLSNINVARNDLRRLAAKEGHDFSELLEALDEAREGADRVRQIVSDLKTFARVDEQRRSPCDLTRIVSAAINMARNETRHRARVITRFDSVSPVLANEGRLGQVFLNLIVNAAQAIPDGHFEENAITITIREVGGSVLASVADTGSGISAEHLQRIYDPFFSTKAVGEGTGLGLFIAKNIVRDLGGAITVESTPGLGTTFEVRLPTTALPYTGTAPSPAPSLQAATILLVDDEPLLLRALGRMLGRSHAVVLAASGREAISILEQGRRFDVLLCDMMMPDLSGIDVWEHLRELDPQQQRRFVFMTGGTFTDRARAFIEAHHPLILEKPFTASAFSSMLGQLGTPLASRESR